MNLERSIDEIAKKCLQLNFLTKSDLMILFHNFDGRHLRDSNNLMLFRVFDQFIDQFMYLPNFTSISLWNSLTLFRSLLPNSFCPFSRRSWPCRGQDLLLWHPPLQRGDEDVDDNNDVDGDLVKRRFDALPHLEMNVETHF